MEDQKTVKVNQKIQTDNEYFDQQDLRIINILAPGQHEELEDVPWVNALTIKQYFQYLNKKITTGLLLTGRESLGYFSWEERFEWEGETGSNYDRLRRDKGSYKDKYFLQSLYERTNEMQITATVMRKNDKKVFEIPLNDLEVCHKNSKEYQILEDYSYWFVNFYDD